MLGRHRCHDNNGDEASNNNHKKSKALKVWQKAIPKYRNRYREPANQHQGHVDMPRLDDQVRMVDGVHLNKQFRHDIDNRRKIEHPAKEVQKSSIETNHPAGSRSWRDRCPMIHSTSGRHRGGKLRDEVSIRAKTNSCNEQGKYLGDRCRNKTIV